MARFFVGDFNGDGRAEILSYYQNSGNWWLGSNGVWTLAGNTSGFGNLADGRPIWVANFAGTGKTDILFYYPGDRNWWLGQFSIINQLTWNLAGNTSGFGQVWDGRPFWIADFTGDGRADVLFHYPGDKNWWLGSFSGNQLQWTLAGNTSGFGNVADGRPIWAANFAGTNKADILFYYPGDRNWWLGQFSNTNQLAWNFAGNTSGFGQVWDGRPFWIADFTGDGRADVLFHYPGDKNWWLGSFSGNQLQWTFAGNTSGFGNVADGRPIWTADFAGTGKAEVLFYYPGDQNWWLGQFSNTNQLAWNFAGNTSGFGQVWDGRPFWIADFTGDGRADVLFHYSGDGNWWRGSFSGNQLQWILTGTSGLLYSVNMNVILVGSDQFSQAERNEVNDAIQRTRQIYGSVGLFVDAVAWYGIPIANANGREHIDSDGEAESLTDEWTVHNHALDVFFVKTYAGTTIGLSPVDGPCNKDAKGMDGSVVAIEESNAITGLVVAHEAGHYLGLDHVDDATNLMNPSAPNGGILTTVQGNNMKDHCFITT